LFDNFVFFKNEYNMNNKKDNRIFLILNLGIIISILCTTASVIIIHTITSNEKNITVLKYSAIILCILSLLFTAGIFLTANSRFKNQLHQLLKKIAILSITDELTSLYNRNYFFKKLSEEFERSRRYNHPLSLVIANIDCFKAYNEKYSLKSGDFVLSSIADIMKEICRESDFIARYGEDEFAIILTDTGEKGALIIAEKLRHKVEEYTYGNNREHVTISLGISTLSPDTAYSAETLIYDADTALFRAKENGKNRSELFIPA